MRDQELVRFLQWCLPRLGLEWSGFRKVRRTVGKRVARRMRALGLADLDAYRDRLERDPEEWRQLERFCLIPISRFWRDREVYRLLAERVLPALAAVAAEDGRQRVRCLSVGCASGEEPYSVALAWRVKAARDQPRLGLDIVAVDADPTLLKRARAACYKSGSLKEVPAAMREAAFEAADGLLRLREEFRESVRFVQGDMREGLPQGPFDLMLCRNLAFTYFDAPGRAQAFAALDARLRPGGLLVVGSHEALPSAAEAYRRASPGVPVYRKPAPANGGRCR